MLGLVSFLVYNANMRSIPAADTYAARYLPFSIWRNHSVVLDPIVTSVALGRKTPTSQGQGEAAFWIRKVRGDHFISAYPIVVPVVIAPLYLPAVTYLDAKGWDPLLFDKVARIMEKLCASLLAAASVTLLYLLLRRRSNAGTAALLSVVYAFGTTTWVISSQALWMHGLAQLLIVATMLLLTGPRTAIRAVVAGFLCALIAANRQPDAILAAGLGLYGLWWAGRMIPLFVTSALIPVGLILAYNLLLVGHFAGAYALLIRPDNFNDNVPAGVAGLLFSPTRGLFVFSPFLLFVPCFLLLVLRDRSTRGLTTAIGGAMVLQVIFYGMVDWRQGISWGPRWLTDMLPMLMWMLPPVLGALSLVGRVVFGLACGLAIAIEVVGAFWYTGVADVAVMALEGPDRMRPAWDIHNAAFIAELNHPRAPADLLVDLRGNVDVIDDVDVVDAVARRDAGADRRARQVEILGWALTNRRSPADVVAMIDGRPMAGTDDFFTRPDVVRTLGEARPAGWRITFPADQLASGEHAVTILVRAHKGGEQRFLLERKFTLAPDDEAHRRDRELTNAARRAVEILAERQQGPGYWLTSYTGGTQFEQPQQEMNTYLNAVMLDVAAPVGKAAGMADMLARARQFLTNQIEAGGLVRYHGRPDAPTIGTLGCAITPDSDDTALVWRAAPSERRELLPTALATLNQFRRPDGLYRTWLAPQERTECLDPGRDPNPADIGIQMHVFMLLAQEDPPAAHALCEALTRKSADDDIWVYYAGAPPMLILRLTDLRRAGCPLQLPLSRLQTTVPGQEIWIRATQLLQQMESTASTYAAYSETAELLRKIAANNFSLLTRAPPLLYHNDLTATVRRYYWSEELGYALWLRLYFENELMRSKLLCGSDDAEQKCGDK
ncbi:hypothetical protein SAMN05444161_2385 [Rhizobiales bacterium GAS191]|nr:hypothetical protein SAMN05444161_2385 [Rhizobiales bacterium GAS191]